MRNKNNKCGQALVIGIFALIPMAMFMCMIVNVSMLIEHKRDLQTAADHSAAAGALVQADMISSIAWINIALADIHAQATRVAVNTSVSGTLAELEQDSKDAELMAATWGTSASFDMPSALVGKADEFKNSVFPEALKEIDPNPENLNEKVSNNNLPRGRALQWQKRLEVMQANIAALSGTLIKRHIWRTAMVNLGVEDPQNKEGQVHVNLFPFHAKYIPSGEKSESWWITQSTDKKSFEMLEKISQRNVKIDISGTTVYQIVVDDGQGDVSEFTIDFQPNGHILITHEGTTTDVYWDDNIPAWVVNGEIPIKEGENGGTEIDGKEYRTDPNTGGLEVWEDGEWVALPTTFELPSGVDLPVTSGGIDLGGINFNLTNNDVSFGLGGLHFQFHPKGSSVEISGRVSPLTSLHFVYSADNPDATELNLNGRWKIDKDRATGQWELYDRRRERLTWRGLDSGFDEGFIFDIETQGDYIVEDTNNARFAIDQVQGLFGDHFNTHWNEQTWLYDADEPDYGWYDVASGTIAEKNTYDHENHYHQTATCWHGLDKECPGHKASGEPCLGLKDIIESTTNKQGTPYENMEASYYFGDSQAGKSDGGFHATQLFKIPNTDPQQYTTFPFLKSIWQPCPLCTENGYESNNYEIGNKVVSDDSSQLYWYDPQTDSNPNDNDQPLMLGYILDVYELLSNDEIKGGYKIIRRFPNGGRTDIRYIVDYIGDTQSDIRRYPESNLSVESVVNPNIASIDGTPVDISANPMTTKNSRLRVSSEPYDNAGTSYSYTDNNGILKKYRELEIWNLKNPRRLVLSENFFKWGINVAIHNNKNPYDGLMLPNLFKTLTSKSFSPIATASAKIGFVVPGTDEIRFRWTDEDLKNNNPDPLNIDTVNLLTEYWAKNDEHNLMVTEWVAKMISTRDAFSPEDLELDQEATWTDISIPPSGDAPGIALLKHYLDRNTGQWRHNYAGPTSINSSAVHHDGRNKEGNPWNLSNADLDEWIKH